MADTIQDVFNGIKAVDPQKVKDINATYQWDISGDGGGTWHVKFAGGEVSVNQGPADSPQITLTVAASDLLDIVNKKQNAQMAFLTGKLKIKGDMALAMKLQSILG